MFQVMLLSIIIAISCTIFSSEAFQPHHLIKNSMIKQQRIKMSITPPEFLELSNTLNVATLSVIPSSVLSTDLIFSFIHQNSAIIFWVVNAFIFNLAKGGSYPIGPLALPEGTTEYPSLLNKVYTPLSSIYNLSYLISLTILSIHTSIQLSVHFRFICM